MAKVKSTPIYRQVWEALNGQLHVTIPIKNPENIVDGDWVEIKSVTPKLVNGRCTKCKRLYQDHTIKEIFDHGIDDRVV